MKYLFTALVGVACITGCTATEDPCAAANRDVTFGSLLTNSVSGSYSACLGQQRQELSRLRMEASLLDGEALRLRNLAAQQSSEQSALTLRLAEANARQASLARDIARSERQLSASEQDLRVLLARENALRQRLESGSLRTATPAEIEAIEAEQESIRSILDAFIGA